MTNKLRWMSLVLVCVLGVFTAVPAFAHHSFSAEFNSDLPETFTGTLTRIDWINPHVRMAFDEKNDKGQTVQWTVECGPTGHFHAAHLKKDMFQPGQVIQVRVYMAKDGTKNFGWMRNITFIGGPYNGQGYEMWGGGLDEHGNPIQD